MSLPGLKSMCLWGTAPSGERGENLFPGLPHLLPAAAVLLGPFLCPCQHLQISLTPISVSCLLTLYGVLLFLIILLLHLDWSYGCKVCSQHPGYIRIHHSPMCASRTCAFAFFFIIIIQIPNPL